MKDKYIGITVFVLLLSGLLFSIRQEYKNDKILKTIEVTKVVINKNVSVQTELTYSYNVFNGNFYQRLAALRLFAPCTRLQVIDKLNGANSTKPLLPAGAVYLAGF